MAVVTLEPGFVRTAFVEIMWNLPRRRRRSPSQFVGRAHVASGVVPRSQVGMSRGAGEPTPNE